MNEKPVLYTIGEFEELKQQRDELYRSITTAIHLLKYCNNTKDAIDELDKAIAKVGEL